MSRGKLITKVQRKADGPKQKINASEVSRVSKLLLDEILEKMDELERGRDGYNTTWLALKSFIKTKRAKRKR